jgi:predicted  nucleic acid-binding Zn-ribbon protein
LNDPTDQRRSGRVEMAMPVRIKGMSNQTKFFDEAAETVLISKYGFMTRLRARVDLETEVHVTSLTNNRTGAFRVAWISDSSSDGLYNLGLELIATEGDLWGIRFPAAELGEDEVAIKLWLACRRCRQKLLTEVPEAEYGHLTEGFLIARNCVKCRATTTWEFSPEGTVKAATDTDTAPQAEAPPRAASQGEAKPEKAAGVDLRKSGRVPLQMQVKVTRHKFGTEIEDLCDTINISRNGAYFLTSQHYDVGETVQVVLPYKEGDLAIPVPARVVRTDTPQNSPLRAVAVHLQQERPEGLHAGAPGEKR